MKMSFIEQVRKNNKEMFKGIYFIVGKKVDKTLQKEQMEENQRQASLMKSKNGLSNKQRKARAASKVAKQSRKRNRQ
jgi:hypothetical protein